MSVLRTGKPGRGSSPNDLLTKGFPKPCHGRGAQGRGAAAPVPGHRHRDPEVKGHLERGEALALDRSGTSGGPTPEPSRSRAPRPRPSPPPTSQCHSPATSKQLRDVRRAPAPEGSAREVCPDSFGKKLSQMPANTRHPPPPRGARRRRPGRATAPDLAKRTHASGSGPPRTLHRLLPPAAAAPREERCHRRRRGTPRLLLDAPGEAPEGKSSALLCLSICTSRFLYLPVPTSPPQ